MYKARRVSDHVIVLVGIEFSFYDFDIWFWNCSECVVFFFLPLSMILIFNPGIVPNVWYFFFCLFLWFWYLILELFRMCGIFFCLFLWFWYLILELFRMCGISFLWPLSIILIFNPGIVPNVWYLIFFFFLPLSTILIFDPGIVANVWYFLFFLPLEHPRHHFSFLIIWLSNLLTLRIPDEASYSRNASCTLN